MADRRTIQRIIDEEVSRILEADNSFQDSQFKGGGNFFNKQRDWSNGNPDQQSQQQQQTQQPQQAQQDNGEGQQKRGFFGRMRDWASQKFGGMKNAIGQKVDRMAEKNFSQQAPDAQKGIIAELVKYKCLDQNTAVELHKALYGSEDDISYIAQAAQETQDENAQEGEQGGETDEPSFSGPEEADEGFSDEMVQEMQGKLSEDGSNPYANITVNLIDE